MIRIRIPKLLAKTMQKNSQNGSNMSCNIMSSDVQDKDKNNKKVKKSKWASEIGDLVPKKVGLAFASVFNNKRSSHSLDSRNVEIGEREEHESNIPSMEASESYNVTKPSKVLVCSLNKRKRLMFIRSKVNKNDQRETGIANSNVGCFCNCGRCKNIIRKRMMSRDRSNKVSRLPSMFLTVSSKVKVARSFEEARTTSQQIKTKTFFEGEERQKSIGDCDVGGDVELCKKKILLGAKCKPLNYSGIL